LQVQDVECSEYPCIAWTTWDQERSRELDLPSCEAWAQTYGKRLMLVARDSPDGADHFVGLVSLPDDPGALRVAAQRARMRIGALAQAYGIPVK
jgi:hypothetical protein